jgi:hypothetical protein
MVRVTVAGMAGIMQCGAKLIAHREFLDERVRGNCREVRPAVRRSLSLQIRYLIAFKVSRVALRLPATRRMNYPESRNTTVKE